MTESKLTKEAVVLALGSSCDSRGYRKFSADGRAQALAYAHERLQAGAGASEVASELGLIGWTLQRWLQRERRGDIEPVTKGFVKLEVKPEARREVVLRGPCGVWVEGLEPAGIAAVLRSLSCSA